MESTHAIKEILWSLEPMIFVAGLVITSIHLFSWYSFVLNIWSKKGRIFSLLVTSILPILTMSANLIFVSLFGTPDVVENGGYILMYSLAGMTVLALNYRMMYSVLNISWCDDLLQRDNIASVFPVFGGAIASTAMYLAMNLGGGDGWWCVIAPYFMCWGLWLILAYIIAKYAKASYRITVNRDLGCGIRYGTYLLCSGVFIAILNVGDYYTFAQVCIDFLACLPVLLLTLLTFCTEFLFSKDQSVKIEGRHYLGYLMPSILLSVWYMCATAYLVITMLKIIH